MCNSAYQLLTAVQLRCTIYAEDEVDLLLSNQLAGASKISHNARQTGLFKKVRYIETKRQAFPNRLAEGIHDWRLIRRLKHELGEYDVFCIANISVFSILFVRFYQHKTLEINVYEDGFVTYCRCFENFDRASVIARMLLPHGMLSKVTHIYLFNPELLEWHRPTIEVVSIPKFDKRDIALIAQLNRLFGYEPDPGEYDTPYLFMEESFAADSYKVEDMELVETIANEVGKDNIVIKLHPRNPENRFVRKGYKTNKNTAVPWELVVLNTDMCGHTLISISSCSILQPYLLLGTPIRSISLLKLLKEKPGNMRGELGEFMLSLFEKYADICYSPRTITELKDYFHK